MRRTRLFGQPLGRFVNGRTGSGATAYKSRRDAVGNFTERCIYTGHSKTEDKPKQTKKQDLRRFLEEIGTDPKEARYWLRQFQQHESAPDHPFAVVQVESTVFNHQNMLDKLASCLAFLHRNGMPVVVIHGLDTQMYGNCQTSELDVKKRRAKLLEDNLELVDLLEKHGGKARPFMSSGHVLLAQEPENQGTVDLGTIDEVDVKPLQWCLGSGHVPVLTAVGETPSGQVLCIDSSHAAVEIAQVLQPVKVLFLNARGGLVDQHGSILGQVNTCDELESLLNQPWHSDAILQQVISIAKLLETLPRHSSAVITSADSLITELFTHHGSGTMFLASEEIHKHHSLAEVDLERLQNLLVKSFDKPLSEEFFSTLEDRLHTLYVNESYSAVAVVTREDGVDGVPYLDKFCVSKTSQGQGTSDNLWSKVKQDFSCLFWRSRETNRINPWYFIRCDGSWTNINWTVFWYGINDHSLTLKLVQHATQMPPSFDPQAPHDEEKSKRVLSSNGYHKYL